MTIFLHPPTTSCPKLGQDALASYAHAGKTLILGPGLPYLNMEMFPCNILEKAAGLDNVRLCTKVDAQLLNELDIPVPFKTRDEGIELSCHYRDETVFLWVSRKYTQPHTGMHHRILGKENL